jgi:non-ribosomal peptide synthetase component F/acyl carrier protein
MYTSGSSGLPKGVVIPHRGIARLVINNGYIDFCREDRVAFSSNPAFDAATFEVWGALLNGVTTVIVDADTLLDAAALAGVIEEQRISIMFLTTALFNQHSLLIADALSKLRCLIFGGERTDPAACARLLEAGGPRHFLNAYGPTETTTFALTHRIEAVRSSEAKIPIGSPIGNTLVYLLDKYLQPAPIGGEGELYIGGAGVGLGYLNRPELTAERFIVNPYRSGDILYKTGDLGRWLPDGTIEFLGRNDFQVKVRGFRIEPGEIEAALLRCADVNEAVVLAREEQAGETRLVAYVTGGADIERLRGELAGQLPAYMVPSAFVALDELPLNPNGKVDRKALPAPVGDAYAGHVYEAPQGEIEATLAALWSELLQVERVGRQDNFFDLGGHSLLAVQLISRVRDECLVELSLADLFNEPTLAGFASRIAEADNVDHETIPPVDRNGPLPLSLAQQRLWFLSQMDGAGEAYHLPGALRLQGRLDRAALRKALARIVDRHEALRSRFTQVDGQPVQLIDPPGKAFSLYEEDCRGCENPQADLHARSAAEAAAPFDLETGPLARGRLLRYQDDEHVLLVTLHHIIADGWSIGILVNELSRLYAAYYRGEADPLAPLSIQYADYAAWQRHRLADGHEARLAAFWRHNLAQAPTLLSLPLDHPRPPVQDYRGARLAVSLDADLTESLQRLSQRHGVTLFMTLLSAWAGLLGRLAGQEDVVIGSPVAGRNRAEIEPLIGFFVNTLAQRIDLSGSPTVAELLARTRDQVLATQQHQELPFEQVVELLQPERSLSHTPLFQPLFAWGNLPASELTLPGLTLSSIEAPQHVAQFDLSLHLHSTDSTLEGDIVYATSLFDRATIERFVDYFKLLLQGFVSDDQARIDRIPMLPPHERGWVVEGLNATSRPYPTNLLLHQLFEAQAGRTPEAACASNN